MMEERGFSSPNRLPLATVSFSPAQILRRRVRVAQYALRFGIELGSISRFQFPQHRQCLSANWPPIAGWNFPVRKHSF